MTKENLIREYFDWMYDLVCDDRVSYRRLLKRLHEVEFTYTLPMDDNRAVDGADLRYRFAYDRKHHPAMIAEYLDDRPCSVLEMMIALVNHCCVIMDSPDFENQERTWFMSMIKSMGLDDMTDERYRESYVDRSIARLLTRDYKPNGEGGLFTVRDYRRDLRLVEIWYQMCWYLDEVLQRRSI